MRTTVREDRLLVVSDLHLGNRLHGIARPFREFVRFALAHDYSICINGDGLDLAQLSLAQLNDDLTPSLKPLLRFRETSRRIYYTVGNHDIALEHFLSDMGGMMVAPFLNVHSGDKRIRVEHGHMYDGMFLKFPRLYSLFMLIGRIGIAISPRFYEGLHRFNVGFVAFTEWVFARCAGLFKRGAGDGARADGAGPRDPAGSGGHPGPASGGPDRIPGERECFHEGAVAVGLRGFDAVVFGHTHLAGSVELQPGLTYYNTGAWFHEPFCLAVAGGRVWFGPVADLVRTGDPFPKAAPRPQPRLRTISLWDEPGARVGADYGSLPLEPLTTLRANAPER